MILLFACKRIASYLALFFNPCYNSKGTSPLWTTVNDYRKNISVALYVRATKIERPKYLNDSGSAHKDLVA